MNTQKQTFEDMPKWSATIDHEGDYQIRNHINKLVAFYNPKDLICTINNKKDYPFQKFDTLHQAVRWTFLKTQIPLE